MGERPRKVFGFTYNGSPRRLVSLEETADSSIIFVPARLNFLRAELAPVGRSEEQIGQLKFSIHSSPKSDSFNVVKFTRIVGNSEISAVVPTTVIKSKKGFFYLCGYRLGAYSNSRHQYRKIVSLFPFDTGKCQAFVHYVVSHRDQEVPSAHRGEWFYRDCVMGNVRLHMLFRFMWIRAFDDQYFTMNIVPGRGPTDFAWAAGVIGGASAEALAIQLSMRQLMLEDELFHWIDRAKAGDNEREMLMKIVSLGSTRHHDHRVAQVERDDFWTRFRSVVG